MKKILCFIIALLLIAPFSVFAYSSNDSKEMIFASPFETEEQVFSAMETQMKGARNQDYAGMYIDDNGVLVLQYAKESGAFRQAQSDTTKNSSVLKSADGSMAQRVMIEPVTFNDTQLNTTRDIIENHWDELDGLYGFGVRPQKNTVHLDIMDGTDVDALKKQIVTLVNSNSDITIDAGIFSVDIKQKDGLHEYCVAVNGSTN